MDVTCWDDEHAASKRVFSDQLNALQEIIAVEDIASVGGSFTLKMFATRFRAAAEYFRKLCLDRRALYVDSRGMYFYFISFINRTPHMI
jgi:hypothetical protein